MKKTGIRLAIALLLASSLATGALATDANQAISDGSMEEVYGEDEDDNDEGFEEVDGVIAGENVMEGAEEVPVLD